MANKTFRRIFNFTLLLFVFLISIYLFLHSSYFNIDKIYTTGLKQLSEEEILDFAEIVDGQNIFEIDNKSIARTIRVHHMVKDAQLIRHLPRTLEIKVEERQIWAIIPHNKEFLCIDDEGVVIDKKTTMDLSPYPLITLSKVLDKVNLGQVIDPEGILQIRQLWEMLSKTDQDFISDFHYNDKQELIIYSSNGTEIKVGNEDRLEEKASFIQEIIKLEKEFEQEGLEVLEYVDLRFKGQPVVKTKA